MFYKKFVSPLLDKLDSEMMHDFARESLKLSEISPLTAKLAGWIGRGGARVESPRLQTAIAGIPLENPVMVGAGWDKVGASVLALCELGFSGVEVGSVLEKAQPGNDKPRQYMIGPGVSLNWLGFNSPGMEAVQRNLARYRNRGLVLGINIGKNKEVSDQDAARAYAVVARRLSLEASYFVINVSSPNTPGLRKLQDKPLLTDIVQAVFASTQNVKKPIFVKIAPELENEAIDDVISVVLDNKLQGIVATNTTTNVELKARYGEKWRTAPGGLAGSDPDYQRISTEKIRYIFEQTKGTLAIIGIGGVCDGQSALEKIRAGASAVQVVTGIRGEGPAVAAKINREILEWMDREGVQSLRDVIGKG